MKYLIPLTVVVAAGAYVWREWEKSLAAHLMDAPPMHGISDFDLPD